MYSDKFSSLSLDQKIILISGKDFWTTVSIPKAGIPQLKVTDGPNGARGDLGTGARSACFPCGAASGATWNPDLIAEIAEALAEEAKEKGAHVLLGPTINLQRTPIGGRNFECFSEDPHLTAELAVSYVNALQAKGIGACPKHYVGNDTEYQRFMISSNIDDATLHEVYLQPFERVTKEARPWMIMAAYNAINGISACSHRALNVDLLKNTWGFDGVLVSDWFAGRATVENANGGLDLEMPGPTRIWGDDLKVAIETGQVSEAELDDKVIRLLKLMDRTNPAPMLILEGGTDQPQHRSLIRRAAAESMVLLKNENTKLPLTPSSVPRLAVIGPNAETGQIMGGGSAFVNSHPPVHPLAGFRNAFPDTEVFHSVGCINYKFLPAFEQGTIKTPNGEEGFWQEDYAARDFSGDPIAAKTVNPAAGLFSGVGANGAEQAGSHRLTGLYTPSHSGPRELGVYSAGEARLLINGDVIVDNWTDWKPGGSFFGFGSDEVRGAYIFEAGVTYKIVIEYLRSPAAILGGAKFGISTPLTKTAIEDAAKLAADCDETILVLGSNADWESEGHDRANMNLPGAQNKLAEAVLDANPDTIIIMNVGSPVAMPWYDRANTVLVCWFPGEEMGNALGDVLTGASEPSGRLPFTWPKCIEDHPAFASYPGTDDLQMPYSEGRLTGHRWYEKHGIEPLAAFGHGCGYGDVTIEDIEVLPDARNDVANTARVKLVNKSAHDTLTTVQVYAENPAASADDPGRTLVAFAKVEIKAKSETSATVEVLDASLAVWDKDQKSLVKPATRNLRVGLSSADIVQL